MRLRRAAEIAARLPFTSSGLVEDSAVSDNRRDRVQARVDGGEFRILGIPQPRILDVLLVEGGDILVPKTGEGHGEDVFRENVKRIGGGGSSGNVVFHLPPLESHGWAYRRGRTPAAGTEHFSAGYRGADSADDILQGVSISWGGRPNLKSPPRPPRRHRPISPTRASR